jgi:PST family polysaccharide transporter
MMLLPVQNITNVISPVLHPILSDYQNDLEFIKEKFLKLIKLLAAIGFPVSVILFFMSEELILLFFDNQWRDAVPTFRILTLTVGMQIIGCNFGPIFQAANSTKLLFILGIINSSTYVLLLIVGLVFIGTIEGVAWALVASTVISIFVNWPYLFSFRVS